MMKSTAIKNDKLEIIFHDIVSECLQATKDWRQALPADFDQWDPYIKILLRGFAYQQLQIENKISEILPRFWYELAMRIDPDLLLPALSQTVIRFSQIQETKLIASGFQINGKSKNDCDIVFSTDKDLLLLPLEIAGIWSENSEIIFALRSTQNASNIGQICGDHRPTLSLFLHRDKIQLLMPRLSNYFDSILCQIFVDGDFQSLNSDSFHGQFDPVYIAGNRPFIINPDTFMLYEIVFPENFAPVKSIPGLDIGQECYFIKLIFPDELDHRSNRVTIREYPIDINCILASNIYSKTFTTEFINDEVAHIKIDRILSGSEIVSVNKVSSNFMDFKPLHLADEKSAGTFLLDWDPIDVNKYEARYNLLVKVKPQERKSIKGYPISIEISVTDGENASNFAKGMLNNVVSRGHDTRLLRAENITKSSQYYSSKFFFSQICDWIALRFRNRGRCITSADYQALIHGQFGHYVQSLEISSELSSACSGCLINAIMIDLRLKGGLLIEEYEKEILRRAIKQVLTAYGTICGEIIINFL